MVLINRIWFLNRHSFEFMAGGILGFVKRWVWILGFLDLEKVEKETDELMCQLWPKTFSFHKSKVFQTYITKYYNFQRVKGHFWMTN